MDKQFSELFTERLQSLTAALRFYHKPSGEWRPPQIFETQLPLKKQGHLEGDDFPLICWTHHSGELTHLEPSAFKVSVDCGVLIDESTGSSLEQIASGTRAINSLVFALHGLAARRKIGRYKLQLPFSYIIGSDSKGHEGRQPHPYYWLRLNLSFVAAINTRRK